MKSYCAILAGGVGARMGSEIPKQFLLLNEEPIIIRTIRQVLKCDDFEKVVVAIHPEWRLRFNDMLLGGRIDLQRVLVTNGGGERIDSIVNAINMIHENASVDVHDVIVIHDAVRPFVSVEVLKASIEVASKYGACVAALPAVDTMLEVEDETVRSVPQRSRLFNGQSPDSARIQLLEQAIKSLTDDERKTITGTAQILVVKGFQVRTIPGNPNNIKITTPADMEFARRYLEMNA